MDSILDSMKGVATRQNSNERKLNYRQIRFIEEYLATGVATEAARNAGYKCTKSGMSAKASTLLRDPKIQAEIKRRQAEIANKGIMNAQQLLELYTKIANGEVLDQFGLDASLKDRIAAMKELAKYQIELPMKMAQESKSDTGLTIKLIRDKVES